MSFRFRKRFKILPGIHVNLGRRGPSLSVGVAGAHITASAKQINIGASVPGTGLSWFRRLWSRPQQPKRGYISDGTEENNPEHF